MPLDIGTIHPLRPGGAPEGDPFADIPEWNPEPPKAASAPKGEPFADTPEWQPARPPLAREGGRDIGPAESAGIGGRESLTVGSFPAIHGAVAAGQSEEERKASQEAYAKGEYPSAISELGSLFHGLLKLGLSEEKAKKIYNEERESARKEQESAKEQNPGSYLAGQLGGAVLAPIPGAAAVRGAGAGARLARSLTAGGVGGALYGGGTALSEGEEPLDIAKDAAIGGGVGLAAGGLGHGITELGGAALRKGRDIVQGAIAPQATAERKLGEALRTAQRTGTFGIDREGYAAAHAEGMPVHNIDIGGDATRDLGRAAANLSSEARQIIAGPLAERQEARTGRFADRVYRIMHGTLDSGADRLDLENAGRVANGPRYRHAYVRGDFPIGTDPEMQRLMGSDIIQEAMKKAISTGKDRAIRERQGGFNPGVSVTNDGRIVFTKGRGGVPTYPNIQYWDYVQRELRDMAEKAKRKSPSRGSLIEGLRGDLNKVLDAEVPEFGAARAGAARFFGARDASEAGQNFALGKGEFRDIRDARRAIAQFSPPERELFARGTMDAITEALKNKPDWGTIKRLFTSPRAMERIEAAIGPARARELEVGLRAETMARQTEDRLAGNSSTMRQFSDLARLAGHGVGHGAGGAGAIAAYEVMKEGHADPKHLVAAALTYGLFKTGARHVDNQVAIRLAHALMSEDAAIANRAARTISRSPVLFKALRAGTEAGTRVTAHNAGLAGMTAGMATLYNEAMKSEPHDEPNDDQSVLQDHSP